MIIESIIGGLTAISLGGLWFSKWMVEYQAKQAAKLRAEEKAEEEREQAAIEAEEERERENDPEVKAAKKVEEEKRKVEDEKRKAEKAAERDKEDKALKELMRLRSKSGLVIRYWNGSVKKGRCPICDESFVYENAAGPKSCDCNELPCWHFHETCRVTNKQGTKLGCGAAWLILAKDAQFPKPESTQ